MKTKDTMSGATPNNNIRNKVIGADYDVFAAGSVMLPETARTGI
jgi:hypothetical protein